MPFLRKFPKRYCFVYVMLYLAVYCLLYSIMPSASMTGPKGKALGHRHSKLHGNSPNDSVLAPINIKPNSVGIVGAGKIKVKGVAPNISNTGAVTGPSASNCHPVPNSGKKVFITECGKNIFVETGSSGLSCVMVKKGASNGKNPALTLCAGDAFAEALMDVPYPIGAKGPNPHYGGRHPKKGDGNPGGGKGNGHWGEGNNGNGRGNIYTGNQGHGVGEGMAGGCNPNPTSDPEPNPDPEPDPEEPDPDTDMETTFAAPLAKFAIPSIEGCPRLMHAVAMELGIPEEAVQVTIGNVLAFNPTMQPCEACAALVDAASILRDEDGSGIAAIIQVFNELAPADVPFTMEMATSIAMAFEGAAEGTQYASAREYIDAFVQYVAVLDTDLGSPVGDSMAFVLEKYGTGVVKSGNANMIAHIEAYLAISTK